MKRIAMVMLLSCALTAVAKFSPIGHHWGQAYADDSGDSGDTGDDSGDEDSGK
jgi:hypothetical protein